MSRHGARRRTPRLDISWTPNTFGHPRLGLIVPRHGRSAVARNRIRRRLREHARRALLPCIPALDLVIRCQPAAYDAPRAALYSDLDQWRAQFSR